MRAIDGRRSRSARPKRRRVRDGVDAERGLEALVAGGLVAARPPEGWLLKAYDGDVLVDLIHAPSGGAISDEHFARAEQLEVLAQPMLVASSTDILATKVLSLTEQEPDFGRSLAIARTLREQIDWDLLWGQTSASPFARAFRALCEGLGISVEPLPVAGGDLP